MREGTRLAGRYVLVGLLGRGGTSAVWAAHDEVLARDVAVKLLDPTACAELADGERLAREARAAARLHHPHVVSVYDMGVHDGVTFLVMERLSGRTFADELAAGPVPPARLREVALEVLAALDLAHRRGVLHRDIKPANLLLTADGSVKVADFGIAAVAGEATDPTGPVVLGTPRYLAPERLRGAPATPGADLFALGVLLAQGLAPGADPALARVIGRATAVDPAARYPSAASMAASMAADVVEPATVAMAVAPRPHAHRRAIAVSVALAAATTAGAASLLLHGARSDANTPPAPTSAPATTAADVPVTTLTPGATPAPSTSAPAPASAPARSAAPTIDVPSTTWPAPESTWPWPGRPAPGKHKQNRG